MGYYFDLVFPPEVSTQQDVCRLLGRAGAGKFPPVPDPYYPEPGPGDLRMLEWRGRRGSCPVLDIPARPAVPRLAPANGEPAAGEEPDARTPAWGRDVGWVSIRASWGTGRHMTDLMHDLLDFAALVGARLWDGQTGRFVTREGVEEAAREFGRIAAGFRGLLGGVDERKHRAAIEDLGTGKRSTAGC